VKRIEFAAANIGVWFVNSLEQPDKTNKQSKTSEKRVFLGTTFIIVATFFEQPTNIGIGNIKKNNDFINFAQPFLE